MGVYVKGNPKEGEYKLIKTTDGFVLDGKDIAYACVEIDLVRCWECKYAKYKIEEAEYVKCMITQLFVSKSDFCSYGERRADGNKRRSV